MCSLWLCVNFFMNWNPEVEKDAGKSAESALILVDIEGSSGVYEKEQCKTHSEKWKKARHLLTADVNAAIRGLKAAGIVKIIVKDMHASGFNLVRENIENNVRCLQGHFWKPVPLIGKMPQVDVAIMIGWHAGPDQADGFSPHIFHRVVRCLEINGRPITEVELFASVLGEFNIPAAVLTADYVTINRVIKTMPWLLFHEIPKQQISDEKIAIIHDKIEAKVAKSIKRGSDSYKPLIFGPHQVKMKIPGKTLIWESRSGLDTYRKILAEFVFKPCPELFLPLGLAFYRVWSKMKIMNCKD